MDVFRITIKLQLWPYFSERINLYYSMDHKNELITYSDAISHISDHLPPIRLSLHLGQIPLGVLVLQSNYLLIGRQKVLNIIVGKIWIILLFSFTSCISNLKLLKSHKIIIQLQIFIIIKLLNFNISITKNNGGNSIWNTNSASIVTSLKILLRLVDF